MSGKQKDRIAEKRDRFEQWMKGDHVLIHIDARKEEVEVPLQHQGDPSLTLKVSYYFQGETTHDELGIVSYLKFDGHYIKCALPWTGVWGMTSSDGETHVWPEDVPREVYLQMARSKLVEAGKKLLGKTPKKAENSEEERISAPEKSTEDKPNGKGRSSHLKRIK